MCVPDSMAERTGRHCKRQEDRVQVVVMKRVVVCADLLLDGNLVPEWKHQKNTTATGSF